MQNRDRLRFRGDMIASREELLNYYLVI